jgi:hypothetical protein
MLCENIAKYDKNNKLIRIYNTISDAAKDTNISRSSISKVCLGKPKYHTAGGFIWKYLD